MMYLRMFTDKHPLDCKLLMKYYTKRVHILTFNACVLAIIYTPVAMYIEVYLSMIKACFMHLQNIYILYSGLFEGENFHESIAIRENFTLEIFPLQTC